MRFQDCIEKLRDGKAYTFSKPALNGFFYKAPFPERSKLTELDGACSAITYYSKKTKKPMMPTLMLYDFDDNDWVIRRALKHPRE